ncbi:MAG: Cof-type HAD-IIB family hydrolase [Clostridia bacterium]|nr:Cof-type HAD-IIB family hydrolase [Clostridia bacterium]
MDYKIIASDLDGTLLQYDGSVSSENWKAIEQLREKGVQFVPASGRSFREMPAELRESPLIRYYITSDGTTVYDKETDTTHELPLPQGLAKEVLDKVYQYPMCLMIHADINSYVDAATHNEADYIRYNLDQRWRDFTFATNRTVENFKEFAYGLERPQSIIPFFERMEDLLECKQYFEANPELIVAQSDPYNLEIFHRKAGKGNALMLLADLLGVDRKATIAVGDSTNDLTMVQAAGLGLAMENAVSGLKDAADEVICHYNDHVARYILEKII